MIFIYYHGHFLSIFWTQDSQVLKILKRERERDRRRLQKTCDSKTEKNICAIKCSESGINRAIILWFWQDIILLHHLVPFLRSTPFVTVRHRAADISIFFFKGGGCGGRMMRTRRIRRMKWNVLPDDDGALCAELNLPLHGGLEKVWSARWCRRGTSKIGEISTARWTSHYNQLNRVMSRSFTKTRG